MSGTVDTGMSGADVKQIMGEPESITPLEESVVCYTYPTMKINLRDDKVVVIQYKKGLPSTGAELGDKTGGVMKKPVLPNVPQALKNRAYKPSGKFPAYSIPVMLVGFAAIAAIIGFVAPHIAYLFVVGTSTRIPSIYTSLLLGFMLFILSILIAGAGIGWPMWMVAKLVCCRNPSLVAILGGLSGLGSAILYRDNWTHIERTLGYEGYEISWIGELALWATLLVLVVAGALIPSILVSDTPFCEKCKKWFSGWIENNLSPEIADNLLEGLNQNSLDSLQYVAPNIVGEHLTVKLRHCPTCKETDYQVNAVLHWREPNKSGSEMTNKEELWLSTTVSSQLGNQIKEMLLTKSSLTHLT